MAYRPRRSRGFRVIERPGRDQPFYVVEGPKGRDDVRVVSPDLFSSKRRSKKPDRDEPIDLDAARAVELSEGLTLMKKDRRISRAPRIPTKSRAKPYTLLPGLEDPTVRRPTLLRGRR